MLTFLRDAGVTLKLKKCNLFTETIDFLGIVTRLRRLETASHTTDAMKGIMAPRNVNELKSFLSFCNVFDRFFLNFASIASPCDDKFRNDQPFNYDLNERELEAMKSRQAKLD